MSDEMKPNAEEAATPEAETAAQPTAEDAEKPAAKKPAAKAAGDKPAKEKKPKEPAVEDKPFTEFIQQDYIPALDKALKSQGIDDLELKFAKEKFPPGLGVAEGCWQVIGRWKGGQRQFNLYFTNEDISGQKVFSCASNGTLPSIIEPFLGDERKITLDLLVFGIVQRLNAQKWLNRN